MDTIGRRFAFVRKCTGVSPRRRATRVTDVGISVSHDAETFGRGLGGSGA